MPFPGLVTAVESVFAFAWRAYGVSPSLRALLVVALLLLAGCNVITGGADRTTDTITPVEVPGLGTDSTPDQVAPGLTSDGIVSVRKLSLAHGRALAGKSFTVRHVRTVRGPRDEIRNRTVRTGEFAARFREYRTVRTTMGPNLTLVERNQLNFDGVRITEWTTTDEGTNFRVVINDRGFGTPPIEPETELRFEPDFVRRLAVIFHAVEVTESERIRDEGNSSTVQYRIEGSAVRNPARLVSDRTHSVSTVVLTARVDPRGLVRRLVLRYTVETGTSRLTVTERLRFTDVGSTNVTHGIPATNTTGVLRGPTRTPGNAT